MTTDDNSQAIATQPNSPEPSSLDKRINAVMAVLAPIRPIGMNDEMASDWTAVIVGETAELSDARFNEGCRYAKRECSDHRQVLKAILRGNPEMEDFRRKMNALSVPFFRDHNPPKQIEGKAQKLIADTTRGLRE